MGNDSEITKAQEMQQDEAVRRQRTKREVIEGSDEWSERIEKIVLGRNIIDAGKYKVITRNLSSMIYIFTRQDIGERFYSWRIWLASLIVLFFWFLVSSVLHSDMKATVGMEGLGFDLQMFIFFFLYMVVGVIRKKETKRNQDFIISTGQGDYKELFYKISFKYPHIVEVVFIFSAIGLIGLIGAFYSPTSLHILLAISFLFKMSIDGRERGERVAADWNKADAELDEKQQAMES